MRFMEVLSLWNSGTVLVRFPASISVCGNRCAATLILLPVKPLSLHSIIVHQLHHACSQANHSMQRASNLVRHNLLGTIEHYLHPNNLKVRCAKHNVSTEASCNPSDCHESVFLLLAKCHTEMQARHASGPVPRLHTKQVTFVSCFILVPQRTNRPPKKLLSAWTGQSSSTLFNSQSSERSWPMATSALTPSSSRGSANQFFFSLWLGFRVTSETESWINRLCQDVLQNMGTEWYREK